MILDGLASLRKDHDVLPSSVWIFASDLVIVIVIVRISYSVTQFKGGWARETGRKGNMIGSRKLSTPTRLRQPGPP
jgi:hypothetical protein